MKKILAALAAFCVALTVAIAPAGAMDRTQHLTGLNPPSTWMNQEQRDVRIGVGAGWWMMLAGANASYAGTYSNLTISPVTGLYVAVGPTTANTVGTVYQFLAEETTGYGGYPSGVGTYLPADPTKVVLQGTLTANTANIGPLNPPGSSGQSIDYLIECQVQTSDTTSQSVNIVSAGGSVTATSANRDRVDRPVCQSKAGTAATTGTQVPPTVDTGYVAIGYVAVVYGTVTITTGMVTADPAFSGFAASNVAGATALDTSSTAQTKAGALTAAGLTSTTTVSGTATSGSWLANTSGTTSNLYENMANTGASFYFGIDSSVGATLAVGAPAYSAVWSSPSNVSLCLGTSNTCRLIISGAGAAGFTNTIAGSSNASTVAYVPEVYAPGGTALASTTHIVTGTFTTTTSGGCTNGTSCTLASNGPTFSGSAVFASAPNCTLTDEPVSGVLFTQLYLNNTSTSGFSMGAYNGGGSTITNGSTLTVFYNCIGA